MSTINPILFNTDGYDQSVLNNAAILLQQALIDNQQVEVTGAHAQQLVDMVGAKLNGSTAYLPDATPAPSALKNTLITAAELGTPFTAPLAAAKIAGAVTGTSPANAAESWIESIAGNWGLIVVGSILVIAALVMSQKRNITKVINTTKDVAGKVAAVSALAA